MRHLKDQILRFLVVAMLLSFSGCTSLEGISSTQTVSEKRLLIEVVNNASDLVYPPGKTLTLRVFNNAEAEFDFYPQYGPDRVGVPFHSELRTTKITQEQLSKFSSLIEQLDSESTRTSYPPTQRPLDSNIEVTLTYQSARSNKVITLKENDSHLHLDQSDIYPSALVKLLVLVDEIYYENRKRLLS